MFIELLDGRMVNISLMQIILPTSEADRSGMIQISMSDGTTLHVPKDEAKQIRIRARELSRTHV